MRSVPFLKILWLSRWRCSWKPALSSARISSRLVSAGRRLMGDLNLQDQMSFLRDRQSVSLETFEVEGDCFFDISQRLIVCVPFRNAARQSRHGSCVATFLLRFKDDLVGFLGLHGR